MRYYYLPCFHYFKYSVCILTYETTKIFIKVCHDFFAYIMAIDVSK